MIAFPRRERKAALRLTVTPLLDVARAGAYCLELYLSRKRIFATENTAFTEVKPSQKVTVFLCASRCPLWLILFLEVYSPGT